MSRYNIWIGETQTGDILGYYDINDRKPYFIDIRLDSYDINEESNDINEESNDINEESNDINEESDDISEDNIDLDFYYENPYYIIFKSVY